MKVDIRNIAQQTRLKGWRSDDRNVEDIITELIIKALDSELSKLTEQVIEQMQELEHPEPSNVAEYNERYGLGEGE